MTEKPRVADTFVALRRSAIFRELIPQEAGIGWPLPLRKEGAVYVTYPFYGYEYNQQSKQSTLYPPFATLTINWQNRLPVEYVNLRFRNPLPEGDWEKQAGIFPHPAVTHLSVKEYTELRMQLFDMYDEMLARLTTKSTFSEAWNAKFGKLFRTLMEPGLEPFYRTLAPKFIEQFLPTPGGSLKHV